MSIFRFSFVGEFSANVKFTKCLHVVLATLTFWFAIGEHIFGTTKFYVHKFTIINLFYFSLYNIEYSRFGIFIFKGLHKSPFFSYNGRFNLSEISSLIKKIVLHCQIKYLFFLHDYYFLELIRASAVCNKIILYSALQKFTELEETFWALFSAFSFASFTSFELFGHL